VDEKGQRWDVVEALNSSSSPDEKHRQRKKEVILERWTIELEEPPTSQPYDFGSILPTIYKKCIVFFRSLYSTAKFIPAWKFGKALARGLVGNSLLRINARIISGNERRPSQFDALTHPLYDGGGAVTGDFDLGRTESPAGNFTARVTYRTDCNFRVDDAESLLSSQFMGADEHFFQPSLGTGRDQRRHINRPVEVGSLPVHRQRTAEAEPPQAYGSLSTFHGNAPPLGSSPISALRAARTMGSDTSSPPVGSAPRDRPIQTSRASLRSMEGVAMARRPSSASFHPFKAGSLSSSPGPGMPLPQGGDILPSPSPQSFSRAGGISALAQARNRSSLIAGLPSSLRGVPIVPEGTIPSSASSSPKPASVSKFSSSFGHRRSRTSFGGNSKVDDDQGSSGKQSYSSSAQPGSGVLAEGAGGSSGSLQTDDDNISDFLKMLDEKRTLKSFGPAHGGEATAKRTSVQLSRFQSMRESNNALGDSISSSVLLHRSSSTSSRQLSGIPPMVAATSLSTSSSPGKPISPHTPHTPAIPSRLSANSIADYDVPRLSHRARTSPALQNLESATEVTGATGYGSNAIDIPTSPRPYYPHNRRSSSVAQQHRALADDDEIGDLPFGVHRSISLGADSRSPPSLDALRGMQAADATPDNDSSDRILQPSSHTEEQSTSMARQSSSFLDREEGPQALRGLGMHSGSASSPYRPRIGRSGGRGLTPPQTGSYSSLANTDRGSVSGSDRVGGGRYSFTKPGGVYEQDDEPLLFDMSEIGRDNSRRSLEEGRGGGVLGDRGDYAARGGDSGASSRRGSRRGW
jgi:autophagy-related protein 13